MLNKQPLLPSIGLKCYDPKYSRLLGGIQDFSKVSLNLQTGEFSTTSRDKKTSSVSLQKGVFGDHIKTIKGVLSGSVIHQNGLGGNKIESVTLKDSGVMVLEVGGSQVIGAFLPKVDGGLKDWVGVNALQKAIEKLLAPTLSWITKNSMYELTIPASVEISPSKIRINFLSSWADDSLEKWSFYYIKRAGSAISMTEVRVAGDSNQMKEACSDKGNVRALISDASAYLDRSFGEIDFLMGFYAGEDLQDRSILFPIFRGSLKSGFHSLQDYKGVCFIGSDRLELL